MTETAPAVTTPGQNRGRGTEQPRSHERKPKAGTMAPSPTLGFCTLWQREMEWPLVASEKLHSCAIHFLCHAESREAVGISADNGRACRVCIPAATRASLCLCSSLLELSRHSTIYIFLFSLFYFINSLFTFPQWWHRSPCVAEPLAFLWEILSLDHSDGSANKDPCHQVWWLEFHPQEPHEGTREPTTANCPLTSTQLLWYAHAHWHLNKYKINKSF